MLRLFHYNGSGSLGNRGAVGKDYCRFIWSILKYTLGTGEDKFTMASGKVLNHVYVIASKEQDFVRKWTLVIWN